MASVQPATSGFFQLFQAHCHSDLGPININWFEELTREAVRLQPRPHEDDKRGLPQDNNIFKTPQQKPSHSSQLEGTPAIFREQSLCSPLFLSPTRDQEKSQVTAENVRFVDKTQQSPDTTAPASDVFGTSNRYLADSPAVMQHLFKTPFCDGKYLQRTPQQDRKFDMADSFLWTPQLIRNQSSTCITESLGLEADPEMSWSSSLATPPSPTVIIAQAKEDICKPREYNREDVVIVRSLFSKMNSAAEAVSLPPPPNTKIDRDSTRIEDSITSEHVEKSSDHLKAQQKKTVLNAVGNEEACQVVENAIEGMEDVLSIFFTNERPSELRKVKVDRRVKRKDKPFSDVLGKSDSLIENPEEKNPQHHNINSKLPQQKTCSRDISLSYEWTPLNLPDTTQENFAGGGDYNRMQNSTCNDSQLQRDESAAKGANETNPTDQDGLLSATQSKEHEKSEEQLPQDASSTSKHLVGLVSGDHSSSFATDRDTRWKSSSISNQKPKPVLSTLKKPTRFLYSLKMDCPQTETTEKIDRTLRSETPDVQPRSVLDLKNDASAHGPPKEKLAVNEDDDDFKDNSIDVQEIEDTFMDMMQTGPTTSGEKSTLHRRAVSTITELQVPQVESISQLEDAALQHSGAMLAHGGAKVNVLDSVTGDRDREHNSEEHALISRNSCDSISTTPHPAKAESESTNKTCSGSLVGANLESFGGFKTASNKKIHSTEENLRKGELLLKDAALPFLSPTKTENGDKTPKTVDTVTHEGFQAASPKQIIATESGLVKGSILFQDTEQEIYQNPSKRRKSNNHQTASNLEPGQEDMAGNIKPVASRNLGGEIKEENKAPITSSMCKPPSSDSQVKGDISTQGLKENSVLIPNVTPTEISKRNLQGLSNGIESHIYDKFTESQKAEINELSSILENAGSQFDFTQVKKLNILALDNENVPNPKTSASDSQKLNTSDVWKDVDFNDSFAAGEGNIESNVSSVASESESKSDTDSKLVPDSLVTRRDGTVGGVTLTNVNITDEDLMTAMGVFGELEEKAKEKNTNTMQDLNSPKPQTSNVLQATADNTSATPLVSKASDIIQATGVSPHAQTEEKYASDTGLFNEQEHECKSDESENQIENSERRPPLERHCDNTSGRFKNPPSTSCQSMMPVGFATAKGKLININKTSLDKVRAVFNDILDTSDPCEDLCRTRTVHDPGLFIETSAHQATSTCAGKKTHRPSSDQSPVVSSKASKVPKVISDGPAEKPKPVLHVLRKEVNKESRLPQQNNSMSNMSLFSTAGGKPVQVSEEGLKSARKMFSEVDNGRVDKEQSAGSVLPESSVSSASLHDIQSKSGPETTCNFPQPGFSTANGKMLAKSEKFLQKAQEIFADIGELDLDVRCQSKSKVCDQGENKVLDFSDCLDPRMNSSGTQVGKNTPLDNQMTAGLGSEVSADITPLDNISNKEMSNKTCSREDTIPNLSMTSFSSAGGKPIQLSEDSLKKAQGMFDDLDHSLLLDQGKIGSSVNQNKSGNPKSTLPLLGFSTASGKTVAVSQSSLQKVKQLFVDTDDTVSDAGHKTPARSVDTLESDQRAPSNSAEVKDLKTSLKQCTNLTLGKDLDEGAGTSMRFPQQESSNTKMPLFSTASGSRVHLSSKDLQKAREMFADFNDEPVEDQENVPTGSIIKENEEMTNTGGNLDNTQRPAMQVNAPAVARPPIAFSTANGKAVTISRDSLQKAKLLFVDADNPQDNADRSQDNATIKRNQGQECGGFSTAGTCQTNKTSSSVMGKTSKFYSDGKESTNNTGELVVEDGFVPKMPCFSTAGGKSVTVSEESLKRTRELFSEVDNGCSSQHYAAVDIQPSPKSTLKERKPFEEKDSRPVPTKTSFGFSTAGGKSVTVSEESLKRTRELFSEVDNGCSSQHYAAVDIQPSPKSTLKERKPFEEKDSRPVPTKTSFGFSTAGGKSVTVSEESLKRTRELFSEVDNGCSSQHYAAVDIQPNHKSTLKERKPLEEKDSCPVPTKTSFGFSTGGGKQVLVSEDALRKVKGFFEECNTNEDQESVRMNTPNPLLNKPRLQDSVPKLGYLQKNAAEGKGGKHNTSSRSSDFPIGSVPRPRCVNHSTPLYGAGTSNLYFTSSHTPENDFEIEAAESAKAFMDDEDLTDAEVRTDGLLPCSDKLPNIRNGKRLRSDDGIPRGEPPIKRQLLPEFDRSLENESKAALRPLTSNPYETLKDRRKYFYNVSLQALSSDPASFLKGNKDTLDSRHTPPKLLHSKSNASRSSLPASSTHVPADCTNGPHNISRPVTSSFVIPFMRKHDASSDQTVNTPRPCQDNPTELITEHRIEIGTSQTDGSETDFSNLASNICCARDLQEMRIRKKQRQKIKPLPGSLYRQKSSSTSRINLVTAVEGRHPTVYTPAELYRWGILKNHIGINSERARTFEFDCLEYFPRESFLSEGGVRIADGGWLIPTDRLTLGREEFYRALCDTPGVDPKLISPEWVHNHYRWIVWKLAAMEVMFPRIFAVRCLTPDRVLLQLKYRYDVEIDQCRRSAVRRIMERDDTPAKTLVLCISKILTLGNSETNDSKQTCAMMEATDGWYGAKVLLDPALTCLLKKGRMFIGQKIMVHGAELVGSDDACAPLEAPDSLMLKIAGNSTRAARWYARLGYFHDPRPFCLRLSSLLAEGGMVGCVDVLIQRIYPMQWMEKMGNGTYVFRNERAEEREAERHSAKQQKNLEVLFIKIQEEYEKQQVCAVKKRSRRQTLSEPQICALQDGAELYEALQNEPDPGYLESCLSTDQLRALNHHRQVINDKRHAQIQAEFRKAVESSEQEAGSGTRREVTPVWKIRIVDYKDHDSTSAYMLNIWRPLPDLVSLLSEGRRFRIYQLAASQSKGKSDTAAVQLTATKKTQFQQLQPLQHVLEEIYTERQVTEFSQFLEPHFTAAYGEVDVVGLVISTQQKPGAAPLVYLSDETCNIVAMKFYTDLGQLALEEVTKPRNFITAANLRWRSEYMSGVPVVFAGDLSFIAANPKEHHLHKAIQKLRQSIQSVPEFYREMENKLMSILQTHNPQERASIARCSADPHAAAGSRYSTPVAKTNNPQMKRVSTPAGNNTVLSTTIDTDPKTCKKMKGLDYLCRIPSPAPLTPMRTLLSPSLQTVFRPPRSLHKEDRTCAKSSINTRVPDSCNPSKLEGGFVADEELAMINTQALVSGMEGGSKLTNGQEIAASDIQKKRTPSVACPAREEATQEASQAPYQRRLCRKRKQKP